MRLKLKGVRWVRRTLPDGTEAYDYYMRKGGLYLGRNPDDVRRRHAAVMVARIPRLTDVGEGTVDALVTDYLRDRRYIALAPITRREYRRHLEAFREDYGRFAANRISRAVAEKVLGALADTPRTSNYRLQVLRRLFNFAIDTERLDKNPFRGIAPMKSPGRRAVMSIEQQVAAFGALEGALAKGMGRSYRHASWLRAAMLLLLDTAQRVGDVRLMRWSQYRVDRSGRAWIGATQAKTGALVDIPCTKRLQIELDGLARGASGYILETNRGRPPTMAAMSRAWRRICASAGVEGINLQDFRRTAMVRMAELGVTTIQIAAVSGHSIDRTARILETYIPRNRAMAETAIDALSSTDEAAPRARRALPPTEK